MTTDSEALDRTDMEQLKGGDDGALNRLMDRHADAVGNFLHRLLANEDDAADLAQETFVRLYRARETFRPEARFTTWLFTIAANLARNEFRRRARHPNVSLDAPDERTEQSLGERLPSDATAPDHALLGDERRAAVRAAVNRLPEDLREALVLCEWEELPVIEAAAVLDTTPKAVESRLYRARNLLRERLKRWL